MWLGSHTAPDPVTAASTPTFARLCGIADGMAGSVQTLVHMRQYVKDAVRDPAQQIRNLALDIIGTSGFVGQVRAIQLWVQQRIRYVRDPPDVELVQTPQVTLNLQAGDCDDQAVLVASLLTAIGHPCQFMALWFARDPTQGHVVTRTKIGPQWVAVDTIKPVPLGFLPPGISSTYVRDI